MMDELKHPASTLPAPNDAWFTCEDGLWYYEHPHCPVANVRGRGVTKDLAYRHWVMLVQPYL